MARKLFQIRTSHVKLYACLLALVFGLAFAQSLTRSQFLGTFTDPDIGFPCQSSPIIDGTTRLLCESPNGLATLELIGPTRDLESANLVVFVTSDTAQAALSTIYLLGFVKMVYPNWEGGADWLNSAINQAVGGRDVSHLRGGYELTLSVTPSLGLILITAEPW